MSQKLAFGHGIVVLRIIFIEDFIRFMHQIPRVVRLVLLTLFLASGILGLFSVAHADCTPTYDNYLSYAPPPFLPRPMAAGVFNETLRNYNMGVDGYSRYPASSFPLGLFDSALIVDSSGSLGYTYVDGFGVSNAKYRSTCGSTSISISIPGFPNTVIAGGPTIVNGYSTISQYIDNNFRDTGSDIQSHAGLNSLYAIPQNFHFSDDPVVQNRYVDGIIDYIQANHSFPVDISFTPDPDSTPPESYRYTRHVDVPATLCPHTALIAVGGIFSKTTDPFFSFMRSICPDSTISIAGNESVPKITKRIKEAINAQLQAGKGVLVVAHSKGAVIAYNIQSYVSGRDVSFIYIDPPYANFWSGLPFASKFSSTGAAIKLAAESGIATDLRTINWTNGAGSGKSHDPWSYPGYGNNALHLKDLRRKIILTIAAGGCTDAICSLTPGAAVPPLDAPPTINSISATPVMPGDTITIGGSGFSTTTNGFFIENVADPSIHYDILSYQMPSPGVVTFQVPFAPEFPSDTVFGMYRVKVNAANSEFSNELQFPIGSLTSASPSLTSASPNWAAPGSSFSLLGSGFVLLNNSVKLTNAALGDDFVVSNIPSDSTQTRITVTLPPTIPRGTYSLQARYPYADWSTALSFTIASTAPPLINALTPPTAAPGGSVELEGRNLKAGTVVTLSHTGSSSVLLTGSSYSGGKYYEITLPTTLTPGVYQVTASTSGGGTSNTLNLTVVGLPTLSVSAVPLFVAGGDISTISWSSFNADSCQVSINGNVGAVPLSGTATINPYSTVTLTFACTGIGGTTTRSVTITVVPPPTITLTANPLSVAPGGSSKLTWNATDATSCTMAATGGVTGGYPTGSVSSSGSDTTGALSSNATFTLSCSGIGGKTSGSLTILVSNNPSPVPTAPTVLSPNGGEIWVKGATQTIRWSTSGTVTDLYLLQGTTTYPIATTLAGSAYSWLVGTAQSASVDKGYYSIKACQSGTTLCDVSDAPFAMRSPSPFSIGNRVQTIDDVSILADPGGAVLGAQPLGSAGTVIDGPVAIYGQPNYLKIDFDTGIDGWIPETFLAKSLSTGFHIQKTRAITTRRSVSGWYLAAVAQAVRFLAQRLPLGQ